jgi:hypothetical protein
MILGNRISFLAVVCAVVCVYDLYNCIIWNNRVFSFGRAGCVVCMVGLFIFFSIVVCINICFTLMLVCSSSESCLVYLTIFSFTVYPVI